MSAAATVRVVETFTSIQGESTRAGLPCWFVRLAGCNLRCRYCDTRAAQDAGAGEERAVAALAAAWRGSRAAMAEITGGEPLLQAGFPALAQALREADARPVLVETNGSCDLSLIPPGVTAIVDVKGPGSGAGGSFDSANLERLRPGDEVKFVVGDRADFDWAAGFVRRHGLVDRVAAVLFAPEWGRLAPGALGQWILEEGLAVRLQVQLHRVAGLA